MRSAEQAKHQDVVQLSLSALSHLAVPCPCCRQLMTLQPFYRKTCKISTFFVKSRLPQEVCPPVSCTSPACFQSMALSQGEKNKDSCPAGCWGERGQQGGHPRRAPSPLCSELLWDGCVWAGWQLPLPAGAVAQQGLCWQMLFCAN